MNQVIVNALQRWGLGGARVEFHAQRENQIYRVWSPRGQMALRLHRPGLRRASQIKSELIWMQSLAQAGIAVPKPELTLDGEMVAECDGQLVSMIHWLPGRSLGTGQEPLDLPNPSQTFESLGRIFSKMHGLDAPAGLDRPDWSALNLLGDTPLWGRFWEHPDLTDGQRALFTEMRSCGLEALDRMAMPTMLIHADPLQENILVDGAKVYLIDFDDSAYGYPLFDLVTTLVQRLPDPNFQDLHGALLRGYGRKIDRQEFALLLVLRCLTYVGWIADKLDQDGARAMSARIVARAETQTRAFLDGKSPVNQ